MAERFPGTPAPDPEKTIRIGPDEAAELLDHRPLREKLIEKHGPSAPVTAYHQDTFRALQSKEKVRAFYEQELRELGRLVVALGEAHDDIASLSESDKELVRRYAIGTRDQAIVAELASEQGLAAITGKTNQFKKQNAKVLAARYEVVRKFGPPEEMIPDDATQARAFASAYAVPESAKSLEAVDYAPQKRRAHAELFKHYHAATVQLDRLENDEANFRAELMTLSRMRRSDWGRISRIKDSLSEIKKAKKILNKAIENLRKEMREKGIDLPEEE